MMITSLLEKPKNSIFQKPHLSYSRVNRYLLCPEQYRLYYYENLRPKFLPASLVFGKVIHQSLAHFFQTGQDPVAWFEKEWNSLKDAPLRYVYHETFENLSEKGLKLLEKFRDEEKDRFDKIIAVEKTFELNVSTLNLPFIGVIDLLAEMDGQTSIVDFKTSSSTYQDYEADLSDQLTSYCLAEPSANQCVLCVLVKTKEPRIDWFYSSRTSTQIVEYLNKVELIAEKITLQEFYKRQGMWCGMCDFLPVCLENKQRIEETLVQIS